MLLEFPTGSERLGLAGEFPGVSPEEMFAYWTDAELLRLWWPQSARVDSCPGGAYHLSWPSMGWRLSGRILDFEPGAHLRFTWEWDHEPDVPSREVRVSFQRMPGGGTRLVIDHGPYADTPAAREARQQVREGWEHFVGALAEVLARR